MEGKRKTFLHSEGKEIDLVNVILVISHFLISKNKGGNVYE